MKKSVFHIVITLLLLLSSVMVSHAALVDVAIQNIAFNPQHITINPGDTVRWTNDDIALHSSTSGTGCTSDGIWDSGLMSKGGSFQESFNTPGTYPYFCSLHCFTGTVTVNAPSTIPVPSAPLSFTSPLVTSPVLSTDPAQAVPIGVGGVATGGDTLSIQVALEQFAGPVDIYFLLFIPVIDPINIWQFTSDGTLQSLSTGFAPLNPNVTGPISEGLFGDIQTSILTPGQYYVAVLVTPQGDQSLTKYYLWLTSFTL